MKAEAIEFRTKPFGEEVLLIASRNVHGAACGVGVRADS